MAIDFALEQNHTDCVAVIRNHEEKVRPRACVCVGGGGGWMCVCVCVVCVCVCADVKIEACFIGEKH